jgi:hypothetical protein
MRCFLLLGGMLLATLVSAADESWRPLFNEKDLTGSKTSSKQTLRKT